MSLRPSSGIARCLLRAHVGRRPHQHADLGEPGFRRRGDGPRHAEVGDDRVALLDQDVLGLDVAVHDPLPVRVVEGVGRLAREPERACQGKPAVASEMVAKGAALDIRGDIVEKAVRLARVVERQQMRMVQPGHDPDLAQEALGAEHLGESRLQDLERDDAVVPQVAGEIDHGHAAVADLTIDGVPARERGPEAVDQIQHVYFPVSPRAKRRAHQSIPAPLLRAG